MHIKVNLLLKILSSFLFSFLFFFSFISVAEAATYYVSTTGNNNNSGTQDLPFLTINYAATKLIPGDTLYVRGGTYTEALYNVIPSGNASKEVTVSAYPGESPILRPPAGQNFVVYFGANPTIAQYITVNGLTLDATNVSFQVVKADGGANHITIENCVLENSLYSGFLSTHPELGTGYINLINNSIHNNGSHANLDHGIYSGVANNLFDGNIIYSNYAKGIQLYGGANDNTVIRNNVVYSNSGNGIGVYDGDNIQVYNNVVYSNSNGGIYVQYGPTNAKIINNTVYKSGVGILVDQSTNTVVENNITSNGTTGIQILSGDSVNAVVKNNLSTGNSSGNYTDNGTSTTTLNNLFSNSYKTNYTNASGSNFHILSGSDAIDNGISISSVAVDKDGFTRPQHSSYTIGAYEYPTPSTSSPWTQLDWSAGNGQLNWYQVGKFYSASNDINTQTANQVIYSFPEKFTNTGFETDLTGWSSVQPYTIDDEFNATVSAGTVNNSSADPGPGTRTVIDANSKISIGAGTLNFATGAVAMDGIRYQAIPRTSGTLLAGKVTPSDTNGIPAIGWAETSTGTITNALKFNTTAGLQVGGTTIGTYSGGTQYEVAQIMRPSGFYWFIKGGNFSNWSLLWQTVSGNGAEYPAIQAQNTTSVFSADSLHVPASTWLPTPLAYDSFTTDNNFVSTETSGPDNQQTPALSWTGNTWSVIDTTPGDPSTGVAKNTPSIGGEQNGDTGFDNASYWNISGSYSVSNSQLSITNSSGGYIRRAGILTTGTYYLITLDVNSISSGYVTLGSMIGGNSIAGYLNTTGSKIITGRATGSYAYIQGLNAVSATIDNFSIKPLTTSQLFSSVTASSSNVVVSTDITVTPGTESGLVLNLDSTSNPQNFIVVYTDGQDVILEKRVGGVHTKVIDSSVAYAPGRTLRVVKDGSDYSVYYNGAQVSTTKTISDHNNGDVNQPLISANTMHGLFSTYSENTLDNFNLWARGNESQYANIPSDDMTPLRNTTVSHSGGASAYLSALSDGYFTQTINIGNSATYDTSAFAYIDGSTPVDSTYVQLLANGLPITTTYTSVGGGWYKLSGSITATNTNVMYGVQVKAGKNVYLDDMSLNDYASINGNEELLTSSIFQTLRKSDWGTVILSSSTPGNSTARIKVRSSNDATMTSAQPFSNCIALSSGANVESGGCVKDGDMYIQYQLVLASTDGVSLPSVSSVSINFTDYPTSAGTTLCNDPIPVGNNPWLFSAVSKNANQITLNFTNWQTPVDHFILEYGTSPDKYQYAANNIGGNGSTSYTVNSLNANSTYYFRVRAANGCSVGNWSNEISAKTLGLFSKNNLNIVNSTLTPVEPNITTKNSPNPRITQSYSLTVNVKDTKGKPVEGATVTIYSNVQTAKTNKEGVATFTNVEAGQHEVQIAYDNYKGEESINLTADSSTKDFNLNVTVQEKSVVLSPQFIGLGVVALLIISFLGYKLLKTNKKLSKAN